MIFAETENYIVRHIGVASILPQFPPPYGAVDLTGFDPLPVVGDVYDPVAGTFSTPAAPPAMYRVRVLWNLLTTDEQEDLLDSSNKKVKWFCFSVRLDVAVGQSVMLAILNGMETLTIIDATRKAELIAALQ